ncbi:MAG: serine hydrolase [Alphaproteobacteria bacterium]|nr:serine hydrolase [Alphaproteobacteria bacterium]
MSETAIVILAIAGFAIVFPLFWMAIVYLISRIGGWSDLAKRFGSDDPPQGELFTWCSARLRMLCNYSNCLRVTVSDTGIHLRTPVFFKLGHRPLFISFRGRRFAISEFATSGAIHPQGSPWKTNQGPGRPPSCSTAGDWPTAWSKSSTGHEQLEPVALLQTPVLLGQFWCTRRLGKTGMARIVLLFMALWTLLGFASGLALADDPNVSPVARNDGWEVAAAPEHARAGLAALARDLKNDVLANIHAVVVEQDGKLIYEQYLSAPDERWGRPLGETTYNAGKEHDLRSISKSVTSLLLGIALKDRFAEHLKRPVLEFFSDWPGTPDPKMRGVTLEHVLTMTAGLEWNEMDVPYSRSHNDEIMIYYNTNPFAHVLSRPMREAPGERWYYNGGLTMLIAGAVAKITGEPFTKFARRVLFEPLGIHNSRWLGPGRWPDGMPSAASGLRLTTRDLARIGSLVLHNGRWQGKQIVPAEWIHLSSRRLREDLGAWGDNEPMVMAFNGGTAVSPPRRARLKRSPASDTVVSAFSSFPRTVWR